VECLEGFYSKIDSSSVDFTGLAAVYYKAALQASNDRINRVRRGAIIAGLLRTSPEPAILAEMQQENLIDGPPPLL
jgi:hypothetical protein